MVILNYSSTYWRGWRRTGWRRSRMGGKVYAFEAEIKKGPDMDGAYAEFLLLSTDKPSNEINTHSIGT
ncbi:MAG: hypothetical protein LBG96_01535 [Tannerella sp.]|nr:hypothetical protein [Tannerella sp.]